MKNIKEKFGSKLKKRNGFTLIEMLIVVAIIAILVMVSIPLVTTSIDKAKTATDDANLRAAKAVAVIEYVGNNKAAGTYYYDAKNGTLVEEAKGKDVENYGQLDTNKTKIVQVVISATPDATTQSNIKCSWETKPTA